MDVFFVYFSTAYQILVGICAVLCCLFKQILFKGEGIVYQ